MEREMEMEREREGMGGEREGEGGTGGEGGGGEREGESARERESTKERESGMESESARERGNMFTVCHLKLSLFISWILTRKYLCEVGYQVSFYTFFLFYLVCLYLNFNEITV